MLGWHVSIYRQAEGGAEEVQPGVRVVRARAETLGAHPKGADQRSLRAREMRRESRAGFIAKSSGTSINYNRLASRRVR
jgi:hypothetical protein